jgi:hypothetical protein
VAWLLCISCGHDDIAAALLGDMSAVGSGRKRLVGVEAHVPE